MGFPGGSDGKESVCRAGDPGSIPGSGEPLEKEMGTHFSILAWRIPWTEEPDGYSPWGHKQLDTTEQLTLTHLLYLYCIRISSQRLKIKRKSLRLPRWLNGKESTCQCKKHRRQGFHPWVKKSPWSRKWQPSPVLLPGKFHGQRSLVGYSPRGQTRTRLTTNKVTYTSWIEHLQKKKD